MARHIHISAGKAGYRHQLGRARRFLDRLHVTYEEIADLDDVEFQDMAYSFFQHCWHIKDWVRHDSLASDAQKEAVVEMAHQSATLKICQDLCNGTKHLGLDKPKSGSGAAHQSTEMIIDTGTGQFEIDCVLDDGLGNLMSGKKLARDCMAEWERILQSQGLATARLS